METGSQKNPKKGSVSTQNTQLLSPSSPRLQINKDRIKTVVKVLRRERFSNDIFPYIKEETKEEKEIHRKEKRETESLAASEHDLDLFTTSWFLCFRLLLAILDSRLMDSCWYVRVTLSAKSRGGMGIIYVRNLGTFYCPTRNASPRRRKERYCFTCNTPCDRPHLHKFFDFHRPYYCF